MSHQAQILVSCCGTPEEIDLGMVSLMRVLWARGVHTCNGSCQGDSDSKAYVAFPDVLEADKFARLVLDGAVVLGGPRWEYPLSPNAITSDPWEWRLWVRFPLIERGTVAVYFPPDHVRLVTESVEAAPAGALDELPDQLHQVAVSRYAGREVTEAELAAYQRWREAKESGADESEDLDGGDE